ncbi:MAG: sulfotransferase [Chloroflexi bacterium]|nr:sulfotransferase [Chloroflexota bacterium]
MPFSPPPEQPILVTGAHRSGTTWVGKMLCASRRAAYISEPLNVLHRPGVMAAPVDRWYTYINSENEGAYLPALRRTLAMRYNLWAELRSLHSRRDLLRMGRDGWEFASGRLARRIPLLKDPFAVFSIPWFIERLNCRVVVAVRHPAAFASSLKRLEWPFQMEDLLAQPLLMRDLLHPYRAQMEAMPPEDPLGRACLLWSMIYAVVEGFRQAIPEIIVVRHEDLSLQPLEGYRSLYAALGLDFTPRAEATILGSSSAENPGEVSRSAVHSVRLDSRTNLDNWKRRLTPEEIARVRDLTAGVAEAFYPEQAW